jgi:hypothetical protein
MGWGRPWKLLSSLVLVLLLSSCAGGASADVSAFCESYIETEALISSDPGEDPAAWADDATAALTALHEAAPEEISGAVGTIRDALVPAIESGDEEQFFDALESDEVGEASQVVDTYLADECGWEVTPVTAREYVFEGDLDGLQAGINGLAFENSGSEFHEMILFRINDDTTETMEELLALPEEEVGSKVTESGGAFGAPGDSDTLFADLETGRYAIICFLPVGATPDNMEALESGELDDAPPHFAEGMIREFTVGG